MKEDSRIQILGRVYVELQVILEWLKNAPSIYQENYGVTNEFSNEEAAFIAKLEEMLQYVYSSTYKEALEKADTDDINEHYNKVKAFVTALDSKLNMKTAYLMDNDNYICNFVTQQELSSLFGWLPTGRPTNWEPGNITNSNTMLESGCMVAALLNMVKLHNPQADFYELAKKAVKNDSFSTNGCVDWGAFLQNCDINLQYYPSIQNAFTYEKLCRFVKFNDIFVIMNVPYKTAGEPGHFLTLVDIEGVDGKATFTFMPSSTGDINLTSSRRSFGWKVEESTNLIKIPVSSLGGKFENYKEHLRVFAPKGYDFTLLDTKGLGTYFDLEHNKDKDSYTLLCNQENKSQFGNTAGVFIDYNNMSPNKVAVVARNPKDSTALTFTDYASMMAFVEGDYDELLSTPSAKDYEIGNWTYLGNGVFRAEEGATFEQLEESTQVKNIKQDLLFIKNKDWRTSSIDTLISSGDEVYFNLSAKELAILDAITQKASLEITPTDVIELGAWEYLGNGIFRVKSGAMSWELTQYLVDGKTFGNAQYIMKLVMQTEEGMLLFEDRGNKDFGNINPGEIVVFDENDVSMQNIANALEEVQVQTDEPVIISEQNTQEVVVNAESIAGAEAVSEGVTDAEVISNSISAEEIQTRLDNLAEIQNRVINAPMYYENAGGPFNLSDSEGYTWCNQATFDVANTTGFNATALYGEENRWNVNANEAVVNLNNAVESGLITSTTDASVAQDLANQGYTVIVGRSNNSGSGHLATVRYGEIPQGSNQGTNVIHVGSGVSGNRTTAESFGANALVTYYYDLNQTFGSNGGEIGLDK